MPRTTFSIVNAKKRLDREQLATSTFHAPNRRSAKAQTSPTSSSSTKTIPTGLKTWKYTGRVVLKPPTSSQTKKLPVWEASEARMLLFLGATFWFLGLIFQSFPSQKYANKKVLAQTKMLIMNLRGHILPYLAALPCHAAHSEQFLHLTYTYRICVGSIESKFLF